MASVFEILSQNNYDPIKSLIANEKAKLGQSTYVPYTEDFQFGTSESPTQTIYNPRKLELESEKKNIVAEANAAIATAQAATEQKRKDILAVKNIEADGKFVNYTGPEKSKVGVNDQYYDDNNVPKMSLVPEKEINTGNADYDAQPQFLYPEHKDGLKYQELGHGAGYVEPINPEKDAASEVFMSSIYNDDQVYQPNLNEALNNEILNTSDKDLKISSGIAGQEAQEEAKKNADALMAEMVDDRAAAEQLILDEKETIGNTRFGKANSGTISDIDAKIFKEARQQRAYEASLKELAESGADALGKPNELVELTKESNDAQDKWTNNNQYVNIHGAAIQQEIAEFDKDDTLVDRHPVFNKTKAELAAEENLSAAELDRLKSNASTNTIGAGVVQREEDAIKKQQALREQMAAYDSSKYKSATSKYDKPEKSKIPDKYATFGDKRGNPDLLTGKDPFRFTTLTYPTEVTTSPEYGHYMLFYVNAQNKTKYKYHGYNDDGNYAVVGDVVERQTRVYDIEAGEDSDLETAKYTTNYHYNTGANADEVAYQKQQSYSGVRGNVLQSNQVTLMRQRKATEGVASRVDLTSRITDSVALYLPSDVQSNVSASYTGFDMGLLGYLALGGADIIKQVKNRDFEGAARNFIGTGERMLTEMIKKAGITAVDAAFGGTGGTEQVFNKVFGQTTNPFIEVAFNNMSLRDFSYTFNFRPKSADETEEVKAIIQLFRFHMAPELKGTNHRYMTLPSTFDIHYMYQTDPETATENTFYNKIATCVLERCDVNYTPTGVKSFDDGAPTEISMALSFKETELLTKQKINDGF